MKALSILFSLGLASSLAACTVQSTDAASGGAGAAGNTQGQGGSNAGSGGSAGSAQAGAAGQAGSAQAGAAGTAGGAGAAGAAGASGAAGGSGTAGAAGSASTPEVDTCEEAHGFVGCCVDDVVYYYEKGKVESFDCKPMGNVCGWDNSYYNCVPKGTAKPEPSGDFPLACAGAPVASACGSCGDVPQSGKCKGAATVQICITPDSQFEPPHVAEQECPMGWTCKDTADGASCVNPNSCVENDKRCADDHTLETCTAGKWVSLSCGVDLCNATAGKSAGCAVQVAAEGGTTYPLSGVFEYQFRLPNADKSGMGPLQDAAAYYMLIAAWNGTEYVGGAITDPEGKFTIAMTAAPGPETVLYAFPMSFGYDDAQQPLSAVAHPTKGDEQGNNSPKYWQFQYNAPIGAGDTSIGKWLVTEAEGSAAIWIFEWQQYAFNRMHDMYPDKPLKSVLTMWEPGVKFDCGACFHPFGGGGATVDLGNGQSDYYESMFQFTGTEETPKHWQRSSIGHEFGHYVMSNFSISPNEGGPHSGSQASAPGLAYSEGWATFFGQRNMSDDSTPNGLESVYSSVAGGSFWWFDLDQIALDDSGTPKANPGGPIDQDISENLVTYMMWHMWAPSGANPPYKGIGDAPMFNALTSARTTDKSKNRGYYKVDYVDFADGMLCNDPNMSGAISDTAGPVSYPYSSGGSCQ